MPFHVIEPGDSIVNLADIHGVAPEDIWGDGRNAALRAVRERYDALAPGDRLFIPDRTSGTASVATDQRHRFVRNGIPAKIRLQMRVQGRPRANEPYRIVAGGKIIDGVTDAAGVIEAFIPPSARTGALRMGGLDGPEYTLRFAGMEPADTAGGARKRLANEGIEPPVSNDTATDEWRLALCRFQQRHGLASTNTLDDATWTALLALHDRVGAEPESGDDA